MSPPVVDNGPAYIGSDDGNVYALDGYNGLKQWQFTTGGPVHAAPFLADGVLSSPPGANLYAVDAADGQELWRYALDRRGE